MERACDIQDCFCFVFCIFMNLYFVYTEKNSLQPNSNQLPRADAAMPMELMLHSWGWGEGDLLKLREFLLPYFRAGLWLQQNWKVGEDWVISYIGEFLCFDLDYSEQTFLFVRLCPATTQFT